MTYELKPLTDHGIGAEILGLDLTRPATNEVRARLNTDFAVHHVLAIRGPVLQPDDFLRAGEFFGASMRHDSAKDHIPGHPGVFEITNKSKQDQIAPGKPRIPGISYHTDHSNHPVPPKATCLHAVALPSSGGDTQFLDTHHAYDDLPVAMKKRLEGLKAVHVYVSKYSPRSIRKLNDEEIACLPQPVIHPLVRVHPENGRKFLYLNPIRLESIIGMPDDEAQALSRELMEHVMQEKYEYRHRWLLGDTVIWDNRSVLHKANADYDMKELRRLYRFMIKGSLPGEEVLAAEENKALLAAHASRAVA